MELEWVQNEMGVVVALINIITLVLGSVDWLLRVVGGVAAA